MTITLTYDAALARVRVAVDATLNSNPFIEVNDAGWTAFGGTRVRSTAQAHEGVASLLLTPSGVASVARVECAQTPGVVPGVVWRAQAWVRCAVSRNVGIVINWFDGAGIYLSTSSSGGSHAVTANTWAAISVQGTAPASAAHASVSIDMDGTPAGSVTLYVDEARLGVAAALTAATVTFERSTDGVRWTPVRGGTGRAALDGVAGVDDYEFTPGLVNTYRARSFSPVGVEVFTETQTTTPTIDRVWLKSVSRPFLNRPVITRDYSPVQRQSRAGVFAVPGRSFPVVVSDVMSSRGWTLEVRADTVAEARALEVLAASGDILHVQAPAGIDIPSGYVTVGDVEVSRVSRALTDGRRLIAIGMTEVAAPGPEVVGYTATWAGLLAEYGTWSAVLAAFGTWSAALEFVSDPESVIVP